MKSSKLAYVFFGASVLMNIGLVIAYKKVARLAINQQRQLAAAQKKKSTSL